MLLQLPAGILWHSLGSADHIFPLQGLSHRLAVRGEFPDKELGALLDLPDLPKSNCARPVLPSLLNLTSIEKFLLGGFASYSRSELPLDWLLPQSRWPSLCSHLGQLLGWQQWQWPTHIVQPSCILNLPLSLFQHLLLLPCRWGAFQLGMGGALERGLLPFSTSSFHSSLIWSTLLSSLSFLGVSLVLAILLNKQTDLVINWKYCYKIQTTKWENYIKHKYLPIRKWHNFILVRFYLAAILNL